MAVQVLRTIAEPVRLGEKLGRGRSRRALQLGRMKLGEDHRPVGLQQALGSAHSTSILINRTSPFSANRSRAINGTCAAALPVNGAVPSRNRYAPPELSVSAAKVSVAEPDAAPTAARVTTTRSPNRFSATDCSSRSAFAPNGSNA